jgi:hypothetical protein
MYTYICIYRYTYSYIHLYTYAYIYTYRSFIKEQNSEFPVDDEDDDDVYLKKITKRVSQNLILHKNADQPKA